MSEPSAVLEKIGSYTSSSVEAAATAVAFEVFGFLVRYQDLEVVEVALAVETPWPLKLLVEVWVPLAFLRHDRRRGVAVERRES